MANFFSKIFGGLKRLVKKVGSSIKKLGKRVKKFVSRAWRKSKEFIRENPWFWQMALTIAMPYITEFVVGGLKTGMSALATGAGKTTLDAQWVAYRAGTGAMPTWGQVGQAFGTAAEGATWGQRAMGWTLQAPGRAANSITGAINNGWDWLVNKGKSVLGVGNESALADSIAKNTGTDKLINFVKVIEEQNYVPPFGSVGAAVDLTQIPKTTTLESVKAMTEFQKDRIGIDYTFPGQEVTPMALFDPTQVRPGFMFDEELGQWIPSTQPGYVPGPYADTGQPVPDSLLAPSVVKPITGEDAFTSPYAAFDSQGRPLYDAQGNRIQYPSDEGTTSLLPTEEDKTRGATLGQSIVQGVIGGAGNLVQNWVSGWGQEDEGGFASGLPMIGLLAWNNPTIYDQTDLIAQNSGWGYGGPAYSANSQNILPEDPYAQIMKA